METLPHRLRCENMNAYLWTAWIGVIHNSCGKKIFPSTHVEKIFPSNLHSCKHSHIIVCPPKAPDQKWRPFHTDSGAKTWMLTFEPHELALATTHVGKKNCLRLMWKKSCLQICTPANTHTILSVHPGLRIKNGALPHRLKCENMNAYLWTAWLGVIHNSCGKKSSLRLMWKKSCLQICTPANTHTLLSVHPRLRIKNGDPSTQTPVRKHECLPLNRMNWRCWPSVLFRSALNNVRSTNPCKT